MNCIKLHNGIQKIIKGYHRLGLWHRTDEATVKQKLIKTLYFVYYSLFPISLMSGAIVSDNRDESMLLAQSSIICSVEILRLFYVIQRQKEINELLHRIGVYSIIKDENEFSVIYNKLNRFMKWITYFYSYVIVTAGFIVLILPFIGSGKKPFFNIGFPLDYKNDEVGFWIAFLFLCSEVYFSVFIVSFSIIIWYLLYNCGLKYEALGSELRSMGVTRAADKKRKISEVEKRNAFNRDLIAGIKSHKDINEVTQQLESFLYELFSVQLATSALCICASVYNLAFNDSSNVMEYQIYITYIFYNICDIFMVMYFGSEIEVSSDRLSYCLFQSNWMDQPESCKKAIIIFGERLKQTQRLMILKLYPLTLETFTRILNGAYSMFNVLKTMAN